MVKIHRNIIICLLLLVSTANGFGQGHLYSEVTFDRSKVYVGEPVEVSIGIYTSTWFTKGVNFGNIKVNGAFSVYFRSVASSKRVNGKNYSGVVAIYNVFPYDNQDLEFPSLELNVETPNEGDSKGVRRTIKTNPRKITVKPVPNNYKSDQWLVSTGVTVQESWQGDLNNVKVGDVIQRRIYRNAYRTVSELIPPIHWDSIENISLYPTRAEIKSEKTKTSISASRSEGVRYLFEKEGPVTLPEIAITWWNPRQNKLFKRTLAARTIDVLPNPDLGMLESVRDSLQIAQTSSQENDSEKVAQTIFGLSLKQFLTYLFIALILLLSIYKFLRWLLFKKGLLNQWRRKKAAYLISETYFFKLFLSKVSDKNNAVSLTALYEWIDHLELSEPTIDNLARNYGSKNFLADLDNIEKSGDFKVIDQLHHIKEARQNYLKQRNSPDQNTSPNWINPSSFS
ncbi:BatD family protein [Lutimonas sp.]|uniref:BatD family protein n=1 Tax=Lutimonas sp. TaxID=1872403 RepID=UPI003D9B8A34